MNREELECHLKTDIRNYGKRYVANPDSRWNTPEFAALAADAVRTLQVLQSTKVFWAKTGGSFSKDMKIIAQTMDNDMEAFQLNLQRAAIQSVPITTLISQAQAQLHVAVQRALQASRTGSYERSVRSPGDCRATTCGGETANDLSGTGKSCCGC